MWATACFSDEQFDTGQHINSLHIWGKQRGQNGAHVRRCVITFLCCTSCSTATTLECTRTNTAQTPLLNRAVVTCHWFSPESYVSCLITSVVKCLGRTESRFEPTIFHLIAWIFNHHTTSRRVCFETALNPKPRSIDAFQEKFTNS